MGRSLWVPFAVALVLAAQGSTAPQAPVWRVAGPEGGQVFSLATNPAAPDTVYAGTSDGVYTSPDFGRSWRRVSSGLPEGAGSVLAVDPRDPQRLYVWADDYPHGGLWRSLDAGRSWRFRGPAPEKLWGVVRLVVPAATPTTVYALTSMWAKPALWRSIDAGRSWSRMWQGTGPGAPFDLAVDPSAPSRVYLGWISGPAGRKLAGGGLRVSADGGRTWRRVVRDDDVDALAIDPTSRVVYAGSSTGRIYRSGDQGASWHVIARLGVRDRVVALAVDPNETRTVYALTTWGVHRSGDHGVTWRLVGTGNFVPRFPSFLATIVVHPQRLGRLLLSPGDTGIWRSDDRGGSWTRSSGGLVATSIQALVSHPKDSLVSYASTGGELWVTRDGARTWRALSQVDASDLAIDPRRPATLYAVQWDRLRRSTDGGRTWTTVRRGPAERVVVDPARPRTLYLSTGKRVVRSTDAGRTWREASNGLPRLRAQEQLRLLAVDPVRTSTLYAVVVTQEPSGPSRAFRTSDRGASWDRLRGFPDLHPLSIVVARDGTVYVGGAGGVSGAVFRSDDRGATWASLLYPMGACANALAADPRRPGVLYAGASHQCSDYPGAVLVTTQWGGFWRVVAGARGDVSGLAVGGKGARLYAGTQGSGVFVARLPLLGD